jgi:hypothetical protein
MDVSLDRNPDGSIAALKVNVATLADAIRPKTPFVPGRAQPAPPTIYLIAAMHSQARPDETDSLRSWFEAIEAERQVGDVSTNYGGSGTNLQPELFGMSLPQLEYRDPWDLARAGSFRTGALRRIKEARYVLADVSELTGNVAYEIGFAMGSQKPLGFLAVNRTHSNGGLATIAPEILEHQIVVELGTDGWRDAFRKLHFELLAQDGVRRCPKFAEDVACEVAHSRPSNTPESRFEVLVAFQSRHAKEAAFLRTLVEESGMVAQGLEEAPLSERGLCGLCFRARNAQAIIADVSRVNSTDAHVNSLRRESLHMMLLAGMAAGLEPPVPTLQLYSQEGGRDSMVDGDLGNWGSDYRRDLTDYWETFQKRGHK